MPNEIRVFLCCVGVTRLNGQRGAVNVFREVENGVEEKGGLKDDHQYQWSKVRSRTIGVVYSVAVPSLAQFHKEGTIFTKTMRYVRRWHRREEAEKWEVEGEQIVQVAALEAKALEAEKEGGWLSESLKPLRSRWQKANALGRAALLGAIVYELDRRDLL